MTSKRMRFATTTPAVDGISSLLEESKAGSVQGTLDSVPIAHIVFDPEQPRRLHLSRTNPSDIADDDVDADIKRAELGPLTELASSIRRHGVIEAVGVYRHGHEYRLIWGERRVLASILAQNETVLARIFPERPRNIRSMQLIENVMRERLSLAERVHCIRQLIDKRSSGDEPLRTAMDLGNEVGWKKSVAYAYWAIATGPDDVMAAIDEGVLGDYKLASAIATNDSAAERHAAIEAARRGESQSPPSEPEQKPLTATVKKAAPRRGRPVTAIPLGKTKSPSVARYIAERLLDEGEFAAYKEADWTDMKTASDILRQVLKRIEDRLK